MVPTQTCLTTCWCCQDDVDESEDEVTDEALSAAAAAAEVAAAVAATLATTTAAEVSAMASSMAADEAASEVGVGAMAAEERRAESAGAGKRKRQAVLAACAGVEIIDVEDEAAAGASSQADAPSWAVAPSWAPSRARAGVQCCRVWGNPQLSAWLVRSCAFCAALTPWLTARTPPFWQSVLGLAVSLVSRSCVLCVRSRCPKPMRAEG